MLHIARLSGGGVNGELEEGDYADYIQAGQDYLTSRRYQEDKDYWEEKYRERPERKQRIYVIFTSGSSGMPKGVMIIHKNLYNYLMTVQNTYGIDQFYTSMITNIFVNLSVTVMFLLILTGAVLEIVNKNLVDELQYIIKKKNSLYKLTPTHMDKLIPR